MGEREQSADATDLYQTSDFIALALGRLAAQRLTPERLAEFRNGLVRDAHRQPNNKYLRFWEGVVEEGPRAVRRALTEPSERGQVLRSVISFRAFVTKNERDAIFREHTRSARVG